jgi:hypothetical protein
MLNELKFNIQAVNFSLSERNDNPAQSPEIDNMGCVLKDIQFERAINEGVISMLDDDLGTSICQSYTLTSRATRRMQAFVNQTYEEARHAVHKVNTRAALKEAKKTIEESIIKLEAFLGSQN